MGRREKQPNLNGDWECSGCHEYLPEWNFYRNSNTSSGLSSRCKPCFIEYQKYYTGKAKRERFEERERLAKAELEVQRLQLELRKKQAAFTKPLTEDDDWLPDRFFSNAPNASE